MNKKIVTLIIVILISFCFLSFVVAENFAYDDNNATDHDNNQTTDENKTDDGPDKNYIIANLATGIEDLGLIIQNPLRVQEMDSNMPLHQRPPIQIP